MVNYIWENMKVDPLNKDLERFLKVFEEVNKRVKKWPEWQRELLTRGKRENTCTHRPSNKSSK